MTLMVNPLQAFHVISGPTLSQGQLWSLTHLYQPLMGPVAVSVYLTLKTYRNKPSQEGLQVHHHLQELINIGIQDFNKARHKIESLYLLDSYLDLESHPDKQHQQVIYQLNLPLEFNDFLNQAVLNTALYNQLGEARYLELIQSQTPQRLSQDRFQKTNASFNEAFYSINTERYQDKLVYGQNENKTPVEYSGSFNYSQFLSYIMADGINHNLLTQKLKDQVYALHHLNHYSESQMAQLVFQALSPDKNNLDYQVLLRKASQPIEQNRNRSSQGSNEKETLVFPRVLNKGQLDERRQVLANKYSNLSQGDIALVLSCEQIPNGTFLSKIKHQKQGFVAKNEANYLENILKVSQLHPAIINFMIYYLLIVENHPSLFNGHLQLLANEWQQAGIKNVAEAIIHTKQKTQTKSKKSGSKSKTYSEVIPQWMQEELVETSQPDESNSIHQDDLAANEYALREKLDNLFKGGEN